MLSPGRGACAFGYKLLSQCVQLSALVSLFQQSRNFSSFLLSCLLIMFQMVNFSLCSYLISDNSI